MNLPHYYALLFGYGTAMILWLIIYISYKELWTAKKPDLEKPAKEFGFGIVAVISVLIIGQLFVHGLLIPESGRLAVLTKSVNQLLIFSPVFLLLWIRKQPLTTVWLPQDKIALRISCGLAIAICSIAVFLMTREGARDLLQVLPDVFSFQNIPHLVQVFLEDVTIAMMFVRLRAWIGTRWSVGIIAFLFAAGHIPAMLSQGANIQELSSLVLDTGLGVALLSILQKAKDIWWFWPLHFAMDIMQYHAM